MATNQPEVKVRISAEGSQEVVSALKRIQSQAQQTSNAGTGMASGFDKVGSSIKGAAVAAAALTAAVGGIAYAVQGISSAVSAGFDFNRAAESAPIAFAAIISSQAKLEDNSGKLLKGQEAYNAALVLSRDLYAQLLVKGQETAASNEQLINAFQITLSSGLAAGVTDMGKLLNLSTTFLQTATALQVPLDQMRQEISSILTAQISSDSVVANSLRITNEQVKKAKEQGTLVQMLEDRMKQFTIAAKDANGTLDVMLANTKEALSRLAGNATKSLFDGVKKGLSTAFDLLIDKSGKLTKPMQEFSDLVDSTAGNVGGALGSAMATLAEMVSSMVAVYKEHESQLTEISSLVSEIFTQMGNVVTEIKAAVGQSDTLGFALDYVKDAAKIAVATFAIMADAIGLSVGAVKFVGSAISKYIVGTIASGIEMLNKLSTAVGGPAIGKGIIDSARKTQASLAKVQAEGEARLLQGAKNTRAAIAAIDKKPSAKRSATTAKASGTATPRITGSALPAEAKDDKKGKAAADKAKREAEALARAQLDAMVAATDREQKLADAQRAIMAQKTKEQYDAGLISLEEYNKARTAEITKQYDDEIKLLEARKVAEASKPTDSAAGRVAQAKEIANIENDIAIKRLEKDRELQKVEFETAKQRKENALAIQEAQQQLLEKTGQVDAAARLALDIELAKQDELLSKAGMVRAEREAYIGTLKKQGEAVIALSAIERQSSEQLRALDAERDKIQQQVATGKMFTFEAEKQIAALEQSRIPALRALAENMMALAKASGDAMQIQRAEDFARQIDALEVSSDIAGKRMAELTKTIEDGLKNSIKDGLMSLADGNMSIADSFKSLARSVVGSLQEMLAEMIAVQAQQAILSSLGLGGGGGGGSGFLSSALSFFAGGFADGGQIQGPGTGTSDSMIARVSNGEFVVNAAATRQNLALLHAINNGQSLRKFATGGLVETAGAVATSSALGSSDGNSVKSEMGITLDDGLVLRYLNTSAGQNAVVNIIQKNKNKINSSLRG